MKSYVFRALAAAVIISSLAIPASAMPVESKAAPPALPYYQAAAEEGSSIAVTVTDGVLGYQEQANESGSEPEEPVSEEKEEEAQDTTVARTGYYPYSIQYEEQNGKPIIIKSFKLPVNVDPSTLIEDEWEEDGYRYTKSEILMDEPEQIVDERTIAEPIVFETEDDDPETIRAAIEPIMEYNQNGYTGQLTLDYDSISTTESDTENYSYPISKTIEVNNLPDNDYAYLKKEMDGLTLQSADWELQSSVQRVDDLIPGTYTAYATYTGTGYGTRATSYTNTAYYTGSVKRVTDGDMICSIVYRGEPLVPWAAIFAAVALLAVAGAVAVMILRGIIIVPALAGWLAKRRSNNEKPPVEVP